MAAHDHNNQASTPPPAEPGQAQPTGIDVKQLAERVYRLMLEDLRLDRARGERTPRRKAR